MFISIYKIKTKQNKTHVNRKIQNISSKQEKKTFFQRQVLEVERTSDAGGWKLFWAFSDEKKVDLVGTVDNR